MRKSIINIKIIVEQVHQRVQDYLFLAYASEVIGRVELAGRMIAPEEMYGCQEYFYHPKQASMVTRWVERAIEESGHLLVYIDNKLSSDRHRGNV